MVDHDAAVHHHGRAGGAGASRRSLVDAAELEPESGRSSGEGVVHDLGEVLAPAEYVHYVNAAWNVLDPAVHGQAQDLVLAGVDRHDLVAAVEQIAGDAVRVAMRLGRETHDRDPSCFLQELPDRVLGRVTE